jgi:hypothetical protein
LLGLDLMRGYFVLVLASIHLDYTPSLLGYIDGRGRLWVSEAEGFFLISGLLVAMMRRRDMERDGLGTATRRSWARALKLYLLAGGLTLLYTALGRAAGALGWSGAKPGLDDGSSWGRVLYNTATLHYVYGWTDFLTFYAPLFVVAPLLVWLMSHRMTWLVVLVSVGLYASMSWRPQLWGAAGAFLQWQVHFVLGAAIGYHLPELRTRFAALRSVARRSLAIAALIGASALYAAGMITLWMPSVRPTGAWYELLIFDSRLGLLRPVFALVMFAGGCVLLAALRRPIMATIGPVLTLFGRNSLYVYVVQSALVFAVPFVTGSHGLLFDTALDLALIALVWLCLRRRFLFRVIPR